ncbi:hypothetical protein MTO96_045796 [Rhipicephalus appendiculatus]
MERQRKTAALKLLIILKRRRAFLRKYWVRPTWTKRADESEFFTATPTEQEWREIAVGFSNRWQFPNCLGAVDGKHVQIKCPRNAGSMYFNYKILLSASDCMRASSAYLEQPRSQGQEEFVLMCSLAMRAFQLRPDFMRPLPGSRTAPEEVQSGSVVQGLYTTHKELYRLSRARRCVENAFRILVSRWRIYERQINMEPDSVEVIVKATCGLHNFLSSNAASTYCPPGYADFQDTFGTVSGGAWRQGPESATVFGLEKTKARNCAKVANAVRQQFVKNFSDEGQLPWQWKVPGVAPHQASTSG